MSAELLMYYVFMMILRQREYKNVKIRIYSGEGEKVGCCGDMRTIK